MSTDVDPFGREYRAGRLSDEETAERMLQTTVSKVHHDGLRVSFDALRFEDLIADAGVARSAVYRRWPTKNHFYADLLLELAGHQHPALSAYDGNTVDLTVQLAREYLSKIATAAGRRWLLVELCRLGATQNFTAIRESTTWNVYVTLTATLAGLPREAQLRADLQHALEHSERGFVENMASFYAAMCEFLGYRLRADLSGVTYEVLAQLGAAMIEGVTLNAMAHPELAGQRFQIDPFQQGELFEWSLPALGFTSVVTSLLEPDPVLSGNWDDDRVCAAAESLDQFAEILAQSSRRSKS